MDEAAPTQETQAQGNTPGSAETSVSTTPQVESSSFSVPQEYADKGWVEKVKSVDDLWKTTANAQELIGKRPSGIPSKDASDAEWDTFYKAMGRPDEAKYDFSDAKVEGMPEDFDVSPYTDVASKVFHEAGLNEKQAKKAFEAYMKLDVAAAENKKSENAENQKKLDGEFDSLVAEHFGDNYDTLEKSTMEAFEKYSPQSLKEGFSTISDHPKALASVVSTIKGLTDEIAKVKKEYGAEGSLPTGSQTSSTSIDDTRSELAKLNTSKESRDFTHPDHKKTMERIEQLRGTMQRHFKK